MTKLRRIKSKITPLFKHDPDDPDGKKPDEAKDGEKGKGILVRKYIKDLDMDFYAGRSLEKGRESSPVTFRMPEDVSKDIGIMVATQKTRFRDRSEFIRTAVYILLNYYAPIVEGQFKERIGLRTTEDLIEWERQEGVRIKKIIESFDSQFASVAEDGDEALHKYLTKVTTSVKNERRAYIRNKLIKAFIRRMKSGSVDPSEYFEDHKTDED